MSKKYDFSVVIPVHNTDMKLLKNCFDSVITQSCGFDHIEMIVVLHNNDPALDDEVKKLLGKYENVVIEVLKNDVYSPSSPRNRGMDIASSEYIGFLDADDMYTPKCVALALSYLRQTGADICHFRRMVELEQESGIILNELVLWDQTKEIIVVDRNTWEGDKLFVGQWGMCTSKIYRRKFLIDNDIRFSDDIRFAEDFDFSIKAYGLANKICLAPQLIGYVYEINSKSLVQTTKVNDDVVIAYAEGFKKIFDKGEKYGIYMNDSIGMLTTYEAILLCTGKDLKDETRAKVKQILEPYVRALKPIRPSKVYPDGRCERMNTYPRKFILGESTGNKHLILDADTYVASGIGGYQGMVLSHILKMGYVTDYGKRFDFPSIFTFEDYRDKLPITTYDDYQPMVNLTIHLGESDIFTDKPITRYALSHGNIGIPRRLPMTDAVMERYVDAYGDLLGTGRYFPMYESMPYKASARTMDNKYTNTLYGLIQSAFIEKHVQDSDRKTSSVVPSEIMFPAQLGSYEYARLVFALADKDLETVFAPNAWILYSSIRLLLKNYMELCEDIKNGVISGCSDIPKESEEIINNRLSPLPDRACELLAVFEKDDFSLKSIWPKLRLVIADGTGSYSIYMDKVKKYIEGVDHSHGILADECCCYGTGVLNSEHFVLDIKSCFYEFMRQDGTTLFAFELKTGEKYRIIASTENGLYRYKSNIFVRPVSVNDDEILVEKCCPVLFEPARMKGLCEEDIYKAVRCVEEKYGLSLSEFSFAKNPFVDGFQLILEPEMIADSEKARTLDVDDVTAFVKETLKDKVMDENYTLRIAFCEQEWGFLFRDTEMYRKKILPDAVYPPHFRELYIK